MEIFIFSRKFLIIFFNRLITFLDHILHFQVHAPEWTDFIQSTMDSIYQKMTSSFAADVLEYEGIAEFISDIKSLSTDVFFRRAHSKGKTIEPGSMVVHEVEVMFSNGKLNITKQVTRFFV